MDNRDRTTVNLSPVQERIEALRSDSAYQRLKLAQKVLLLLEEYLDLLAQASSSPPVSSPRSQQVEGGDLSDREALDLLKGFLNLLIETGTYNGYSLAEIAEILGRESDRELIALVEKIRNGNGNSKTRGKT